MVTRLKTGHWSGEGYNKNRFSVRWGGGRGEQVVLDMPKQRGANGQTYFITSQRNFSAASGATSYLAIMAYMSDTVRKLGFQANVARCIQFDARLLLLLRLLSYLVL